jgi:hypothetical protein
MPRGEPPCPHPTRERDAIVHALLETNGDKT